MPRFALLCACALALVALPACRGRGKPAAPPKDYAAELPAGQSALREVDAAELPRLHFTQAERKALIAGIDHSLAFLAKPGSAQRFRPEMGVTREQAIASLDELKKLLATLDDAELDKAVRSRFRALRSVGCDEQGTVLFTGYYTPIFAASYTADATYRFPIYKRPADLVGGGVDQIGKRRLADGTLTDYPDAAAIESSGMLKGQELAWLSDPFEAYVVRIQGSAKLRLPDGNVIDVGYAGTNGHHYRGIGQDLAADGKIAKDKLNFFSMRQWFHEHPADLPVYAARNPRFVFFQITSGGPFGSLGQPVTADVTVATNKEIFPPGAPLVVGTRVIGAGGAPVDYAALRLDQDTGGAMRAPGRADLYMGVGEESERRAGMQEFEGRMWYLVLK
jgi:membrane-bound lytic murein transglycosylase A